MKTTLDAVKKNKADPSAEEVAAKELVRLAAEQGLSLTGPDGLLKQFTKTVLEIAVNEEMPDHLGHEKNRAAQDRDTSNVRNGSRPKIVSRFVGFLAGTMTSSADRRRFRSSVTDVSGAT